MKITLLLVLLVIIILGLGIYFNYIEINYSATLATYVTAVLGIGIMLFGGIGAVMGRKKGIGGFAIGLIFLVISALSSVTVG